MDVWITKFALTRRIICILEVREISGVGQKVRGNGRRRVFYEEGGE